MTRRPFDAVLVIAFGGPEGRADVRPFLTNVLKGRRGAPERFEEVAKHYEHFGGVSPLAAITRRQVEGLKAHCSASILFELHAPLRSAMGNERSAQTATTNRTIGSTVFRPNALLADTDISGSR